MQIESASPTIGTVFSVVGHTDAPTLKGDATALRQAVDGFVGSVFYGEMLKQLRESPFQSDLFHGGQGEKMFQSQLDGIFAERAGVGRGYELNEAIFQSFVSRVGEEGKGQ